MIHWVVQFALRIAFRSVLHRYTSLEIHRWKSSFFYNIIFSSSREKKIRSLEWILVKGWMWLWFVIILVWEYYKCYIWFFKVHSRFCFFGFAGLHVNDPSAGSPTETLLRLLLPLNGKVWTTSLAQVTVASIECVIRRSHRTIQSVGATGGVYKGQGRNQRELMTHTY
jgi:hypothetical protein